MGGLTSKTFKLRKKDKKESQEEKHASVTGVEYRDKEFQLARETKSAYYYGHKNGKSEGVDKSDEGAGQKKVVLQKAPAVEPRIKVIRDGSSDIVIRPDSITRQKHEMIVEDLTARKPRGDILNTHSVMVKKKESNAIPTATIALDEDKGLTAIAEGKERESQLLAEEQKEESVTTEEQGKKAETGVQHDKETEPTVISVKEGTDVSEQLLVSSMKEPIETQTETTTDDTKDEEHKSDKFAPSIKSDEVHDSEHLSQEKVENKDTSALKENVDEGQTQSSADEDVKDANKQLEKTADECNENQSVMPQDNINANLTINVESEKSIVQESVVPSSDTKNENANSTDSQTTSGTVSTDLINDDSVKDSDQKVLPIVTSDDTAINTMVVGNEIEKEEIHTSNEALVVNTDSVTVSTAKLANTEDIGGSSTVETVKADTELNNSQPQVTVETSQSESTNFND